MEELKARYDYIIIDTPPVGVVIDAAVIAAACDGAIMVLAYRKTGRKEAIAATEQIRRSGCKILGAVLNEVEKSSGSYASKYYKSKEYK